MGVPERCGAGLVNSRCRADPGRRQAEWSGAMRCWRPATGAWEPG